MRSRWGKFDVRQSKRSETENVKFFFPKREAEFYAASVLSLFNLSLALFLFVCFAGGGNVAAQQTENLQKQAERALKSGDFVEAEKLWRAHLTNKPQDLKARLNLSYALFKQRKFTDCYEEALRVQQSDSQNSRAWALIGSSLLTAGNFSLAAQAFDHALLLDESEPLALAGAAMLDFYENRARAGLIKIRRAAELDRREPDFVFNLAQIAARVENYKEAANAYQRFLEIAPRTDGDRRERIRGLIDFFRYLGAQKSLYEMSGAKQTTVVCEIIDNRPVVNVRVNDSSSDAPFRFVLDTGSGMSVISEETARRLGVKPIARGGMARAVGGDGKFEIVYGFLPSLAIGDIRVSNVPVYIRKFHSSTDKVDGYIGLTAIAKFLATLDYAAQTFTLARQEKSSLTDSQKTNNFIQTGEQARDVKIPLRLTSSGFLSGQVNLEGVEPQLNFIVDTGASLSVIDKDAAEQFGMNRFADASQIRVFGAAGITENVTTLTVPQLSLGAQTQKQVMTAVLDLDTINQTSGFEQAGILGGNFLRFYRITFDFRNSVLSLMPNNVSSNEKTGEQTLGQSEQ